jgi:gamma-glutamyl phosphate reductase
MLRDTLLHLKEGAHELRLATAATRSKMLGVVADAINAHIPLLLEDNTKDYTEHSPSLDPAMAQRLKLSGEKLTTLVNGLHFEPVTVSCLKGDGKLLSPTVPWCTSLGKR